MHKRLVITLISLIAAIPAYAEPPVLGGGTAIRVEDITQHKCINVSKSNVSVMLVGLQAKRSDNFWKRTKSLGARFDVGLTNADMKPFSFPRGIELSAKGIHGDVATLPVHYPLLAKYPLGDKAGEGSFRPYLNLTLQFFLINIEDKSNYVKGIQSFITFTKNLPVPPNPYTQGIQLFGDFADRILTENINSEEDKLPVASFSFDLASSDDDVTNCGETGLREGYNAVMFDGPSDDESFLRITDAGKYCYVRQSDLLMYQARDSKGNCDKNAPLKQLYNPYVAFVVTSWSKPGAAPSKSDLLSRVTTANPKYLGEVIGDPKLAAEITAKLLNQARSETGEVKPENVSTALKVLERPRGIAKFRSELEYRSLDTESSWGSGGSGGSVSVVESEAAFNLRECAAAGIQLKDCI